MVEESSFHFALLRVSIIQILKASGFDKCKPSVVNIVTDLYIQYLKLLLLRSLKYSNHRIEGASSAGVDASASGVCVQDVTQAMLDIGFIKPATGENYLDALDVPNYPNVRDYSTRSARSFRDWLLYSDAYRTSERVNTVPRALLKNLLEKRKIENTDEADGAHQQEKDRTTKRLKEKQDYYNHFKRGDAGTGAAPTAAAAHHPSGGDGADSDDPDSLLEQNFNWVNYIAEKDLKLGYDMKFLNTALDADFRQLLTNDSLHPMENKEHRLTAHLNNLYKFDHVLIEIEEEPTGAAAAAGVTVSPELARALPYNLKYSKALLDDPLDEYYAYTQRSQAEAAGSAETAAEEEVAAEE